MPSKDIPKLTSALSDHEVRSIIMDINNQLNMPTGHPPIGFSGVRKFPEESEKMTSYEFEKDLKEWRSMGLITESTYQRAHYEIFVYGREEIRMNDRFVHITDSKERCEEEKRKMVKISNELSIK